MGSQTAPAPGLAAQPGWGSLAAQRQFAKESQPPRRILRLEYDPRSIEQRPGPDGEHHPKAAGWVSEDSASKRLRQGWPWTGLARDRAAIGFESVPAPFAGWA